MGSEPESLALELIGILDEMVNWAEMPDELRIDKWGILARRISASHARDVYEYVHSVLKSIAGDKVKFPKECGERLESLVNRMRSSGIDQEELLRYLRNRAYPLVVIYSSRSKE